MKKRILAAVVAAASVLSLAGCGEKSNNSGSSNTSGGGNSAPANSDGGTTSGGGAGTTSVDNSTVVNELDNITVDVKNPKKVDTGIKPSDSEGKVINIWAWNEEFKGFFDKYYNVPEGYTVRWTVNPSENGVYQQKLDEALLKDKDAAADDKIDIFLAEADYILKYVDSEYTKDVSTIGFKNASTIYNYTAEAVTDSKGVQKGMSFQCCPAGVIYRRSIAKDVIGSDDPAAVQEALSNWTKFDEVAAKAKEKGYMMTGSFAATYRTFSNNTSGKWVNGTDVVVDPAIKQWIKQAKEYMDKGYTQDAGIWDDPNTKEMFKEGKVLCYFGPAWYYNFSMTNVQDRPKKPGTDEIDTDAPMGEHNSWGDWGLCVGPQSYFWGGTWLLAGANTDNPEIVCDIMNAFQSNNEILKQMVEIDSQFVNNQTVNDYFAQGDKRKSEMLGGMNDWAIFADGAKNISLKNATGYDQLLNEKLQDNLKDYFKGTTDLNTAWGNYVNTIKENYAELNMPDSISLD